MRTLTFVRHGQSVANIGGVSTAHHAIALSEVGVRQAQALADWLPAHPARVLASPYDRAQATAQPYAAKWQQTIHTDALLHEMDAIAFPLIDGMVGEERATVAAAYWQAWDPHLCTGVGAETFAQFAERVCTFRQDTMPQLPDGTVVFGHGIWIGMLCWQLMGFAADDSPAMRRFRTFQMGLPMPNGAVYRVREAAAGSGWRMEADESAMQQMRALAAST